MERTPAPGNSGRLQIPPKTFLLTDGTGAECDLTDLIQNGAKFTVLFDRYKQAFGVHAEAGDKHYFRLYHALNRWNKAGLIEYRRSYYDVYSVEPNQKRGIYVKAAEAAYKPPNLIDELQNSKKFADPLQTSAPTEWEGKIPNKCGWLRMHAIRRLLEIDNYQWFIRNKTTHALNPALQKKLSQTEGLFEEWKQESQEKIIILRNLRDGEFVEMPYKTRFTDEARKLKNIAIYNTGIENSLEKWDTGVFLTLTTDPKLWMMPKGEPFTRYIKDDATGKTYQFEGIGKGGTLFDANRHESTAWRKWYEKETQRRGYRIPYIRCVEFQENGLIHTHVMLFGISWDKEWYQFAKEWGENYGQGYMNKAYEVKNTGDKWEWKKERPADSENRSPADYLKKYLIKSMYDTSGFYLYWATNKRFFTMSESVRYYSFDEKIAEEEWKQQHKPKDAFDYVAACTEENIGHEIQQYFKRIEREKGAKPDSRIPKIDITPPPKIERYFKFDESKPQPIENPDEYDEITADGLTPEEIEWERIVKEKQRRRKQEENWLFGNISP